MFGLVAVIPARAAEVVQGVYALPDGKPQVAATLAMAPEGGLRRSLEGHSRDAENRSRATS